MPIVCSPLPSQALLNFLFNYDATTGVLTWQNDPGRKPQFVGMRAGYVDHRDHKGVQIGLFGKTFSAHRIIWKMIYGTEPFEIDHKDNNPRNNCLENLRSANRSKNAQNTKSMRTYKYTSKLKGCYKPKNRNFWVAQIKKDGVHEYIGAFKSETEAHAAYVKRASELFGEFANAGTR